MLKTLQSVDLFGSKRSRCMLKGWLIKNKVTSATFSLRTSAARAVSSMAPAYDPAVVEQRWANSWDATVLSSTPASGEVTDDATAASQRFSMVLPPPNVTGKLHLGHALTLTIQDAICRWRRMCGDEVVWVPGTDHAGIATQVIVEKALWAEQRLTRRDLGREQFLQRVWKWRADRTEQIHHQMRTLGVTLNWDRSVFTMDPSMSAAVSEAFVRLFDAGLLYREEVLVNWCCHLQSAVSDIEVDRRDVEGTMYDIAYPWDEDGSEELVVSTTRPETLLGDTALAVSPEDDRLRHWVGRRVVHPLRPGRPAIPVVADAAVDRHFGTGALKITPAHDPVDFEVGRRHGLQMLNVLTEDGHINEHGGQFQGLSRVEAREAVLQELKSLGLYRGERPHQLSQPICSRTGDIIEPMVKHQWFVRCGEMAAAALRAVDQGDLRLEPPALEHVWKQWLSEGRDWCVSRQLWWGHRIPAFHITSSDGHQQWVAASTQQQAIEKSGLGQHEVVEVRQDEDVLDTWFSSALFPFAVFGWPQQTPDLARWYPLSLMETGHDILFFWVARMVMLGLCLTGQLPFKKVLLHGLICDARGRKMSKSLGNVIDSEHVIAGASLQQLHDQVSQSAGQGYISAAEAERARADLRLSHPDGLPACGADALRLALCSADPRRTFINMDVRDARQARLFGNKLWQACRFTIRHLTENNYKCDLETRLSALRPTSAADRWMLSCLASCVDACCVAMETHSLNMAAVAIQSMLYKQFCDVYLECIKPVLWEGSAEQQQTACAILLTVLETGLLLLHPLMPHLTEELASHLSAFSTTTSTLLRRHYPRATDFSLWKSPELEADVAVCLDAVRELRAVKTKYRITKASPEVWLETLASPAPEDLARMVGTLSRCRVFTDSGAPSGCLLVQGHQWRAQINLRGHMDVAFELQRIDTKIDKIQTKLANMDATTATKKFRRKTSQERKQYAEKMWLLREELAQLRECRQDLLQLKTE